LVGKNNNIASSRRDILSNAGNVVVAAAAAAATLGSEAVLNIISDNSNNNNIVANAAEVDTTTATSSYPTITGIYTDPNYPNGYRILIKKSEGFATLSYSDNDSDDNLLAVEESNGRDRSCIEAIASLSMMDTIDGDVYDVDSEDNAAGLTAFAEEESSSSTYLSAFGSAIVVSSVVIMMAL